MEGWKYIKLGDECLVERGGSPRPIEKYITTDNNGINWIKIGDTTDSMFITSAAQKIIPEGQKKSRNVFKGDFLLSNSMSFGRPYILKIDGCIHDGWLVIRDHKKIFNKHFLYYFLSSPKTYEHLKNLAVGGVVNNLNKELVKGLIIPVPPLEKQNEIADKFDKLELLSNLRKQQLANLDQLVKSRFVEMFGDLENQSRYQTISLGSISNMISGGTPSRKHREFFGGEIPFVSTPYLGPNYIDSFSVECTLTNLGVQMSSTHIIPPYSLLIGNRVGIGKCSINTSKMCTNQDILSFTDFDTNKYNILFIKKVIEQYERFFESKKRGATIKGVPSNIVKAVQIPQAPIEIQNTFASFVQQVDKSKLAVKQSLEKLEILKKSLMQEYFG